MKTISGGALEPVQASERIQALDILRGFALFGILLTNITGYLHRLAPSRADEAARWLVSTFVVWKFFPLFVFLFGVGFAIQLTRAQTRQLPFLRVYLRRLAVLLLIGMAFFVFVQSDDILMQYAVLGAPLLLFRHRSPKALLVWAVVFLALSSVVAPVEDALLRAAGWAPVAQEQAAAATEFAVFEQTSIVRTQELRITGDYGALVAERARRLFLLPPALLLNAHPAKAIFFSMFLFGLYAHRRGVSRTSTRTGD